MHHSSRCRGTQGRGRGSRRCSLAPLRLLDTTPLVGWSHCKGYSQTQKNNSAKKRGTHPVHNHMCDSTHTGITCLRNTQNNIIIALQVRSAAQNSVQTCHCLQSVYKLHNNWNRATHRHNTVGTAGMLAAGTLDLGHLDPCPLAHSPAHCCTWHPAPSVYISNTWQVRPPSSGLMVRSSSHCWKR